MRRFLTILLSGWLAVTALSIAAPVSAQTQQSAAIPRTYPADTIRRADPNKPADQYAREAALADASEAACMAGEMAACTDLGRAYQTGEGRPQNRPVAELLYRKACNGDDGAGCLALSQLLPLTENAEDAAFAAFFAEQACRLGALAGCEAEADALERGAFGPADPQAAEQMRRTICAKGEPSACLSLARMLLEARANEAEVAEGRAILERQCSTGEAAACSAAATHWRRVIGLDSEARAKEYRERACSAGYAAECAMLGDQALQRGSGPEQIAEALAHYERACAGETRFCAEAEELRALPRLERDCDAGDQAACVRLGQWLETGPLPEQRERARAVLGAACDAGADAACGTAARLLADAERDDGERADPAALERYLARGCAADDWQSCDRLAYELDRGTLLPQDRDRSAMLSLALCEGGNVSACSRLEKRAEIDPAAPLMLAGAQFSPELTPEEIEEEARLDREERERAEAEARARRCTTTTVVFEGVSYTDIICDKHVVRVTSRGYAARPGDTPWQALLWRPAKRGNRSLSPQDRVLCGGSVIREGWVLTAAHCINDKHMGGVSIRTGGHVIRLGLTYALGNEGFSYPIIATFRHPEYDPQDLAFDIALVQYDPARGRRGSNARAPARIRLDPVSLSARRIEALGRVATYGWGLTAAVNGVIPDQLRGGRVKLRDRASCTAEIVSFADRKQPVTDAARRFDGLIRRDSVLCADERAGAEGGQACTGDSGGPLISYSDADAIPTLIGVVSGGVNCGATGRPSRYIRIAHPRVQRWLKETLPPARPR
jgi:TPR repeat protein/secreted trypsin-like serine protease